MKCIKYYRQHGGHVTRVNDDIAAAEVAKERAIYAPKHWLRAARKAEMDERDE